MEPILFSKNVPRAKTPVRSSEGAAGWDLCSAEETDTIINSNQIKKITTGISIENRLPNCYWHIYGRSGLAQRGIQVHPGNKIYFLRTDKRTDRRTDQRTDQTDGRTNE